MNKMERINKKLGFGLMRLPMKDGEVDIEQTCLMVDEFIKAGFNYFDTAHGYLSGKSEKAAKTPGQGQPLPRHRGSKASESQPAEQKIEEIRKISGNAGDFPYFLNRFPVLL